MKLLIFGIGKIAQRLMDEQAVMRSDILAFVQSKKTQEKWNGNRVISFEMINSIGEYDYFIIALKRPDDIYRRCLASKINAQKIILLYPLSRNGMFDVSYNIEQCKKIMSEKAVESVLHNFGIIVDDWIARDEKEYIQKNTHETMHVDESFRYYIYEDKFNSAGQINSYFWQDYWAAKKICEIRPQRHYDIGSRVDGFISHLLVSGVNVTMIDIRPLDVSIEGLRFICDDATQLNNIEDESIESISALCSLEHFGLGRYGDPIDPDACYKCFEAIQAKVKRGGNIYISVPIGFEHVEFNAHRVFYASSIKKAFERCELMEYSCATSIFEKNPPLNKYDNDNSIGGGRFGLFWFQKK